jgi:hypothetical protein
VPLAPVAVFLAFVEVAETNFDDGALAGGGEPVQGVVGAEVDIRLGSGGAEVQLELAAAGGAVGDHGGVGADGGTGAVMQAEASMKGEVFIVGTHI